MKKLNRKGFTLIELLAIIVILAIIMVVTIPTVLNSMDSAKETQLQNATDSVSEWLEKQYSLSQMGSLGLGEGVNATFAGQTVSTTSTSPTNFSVDLLEAAGIADAGKNLYTTTDASATNKSTWYYNTIKGRMCVVLYGKADGSFGNHNASSTGC